MQLRVSLCQSCAGKLRQVLQARGAHAMAEAMAEILCKECRARVPHPPERKLRFELSPQHPNFNDSRRR
jgi:hypothetical protein